MKVFITGASAGIGMACAWKFAEARWSLVLNARRGEKLQALAKEIRAKHDVEITLATFDVTDKAAWKTWSTENAATLAKVTAFINNAGLAKGMVTLQEGDPEDWDVTIDTNVKGALYALHSILPAILKNQGHIVNLGSVAGQWVYPKGNVYCASKYALHAISESLRLDLHGSGVRVTEVAPGMVETDFSEVRFKGDKARAKQVYAGVKALQPTDVADCILWAVQRPAHVNIQEIVLYPTDQANVTTVKREPL